MGYQLWTSPVTGHRRRGTRFAEVQQLFERGLTLASIYEPLRCCRTGDMAEHVRAELERLDFDIIGVGDPDTGKAIGWLERDSLQVGSCEQYVQRFEPDHLLADSTPLLKAIPVLAIQRWAFVVAGHGVAGIVTRADLQKPPILALLFGIVSLLETHLTFWIAKRYSDESWTDDISDNRVAKARDLLEKRQARNEQINLLDCLQFCDKRDLVIGDKELREQFALGSKANAKSLFSEAEKLRDHVAHSQYDLVSGNSWPALGDTIAKIEIFLHQSDAFVEGDYGEVVAPRLEVAF